MSSDWLNGIGLICSLLGALLIFRFGVPAYPTRSHAGQSFLLLGGDDRSERAKVEFADRVSKGGALLLALGFALQFVAILV